MNEKFVFIDRWCYTMPIPLRMKDGIIVLISKKSFGPLEIYEWGLDNESNLMSVMNGLKMICMRTKNIAKIFQKKNY